MWTAPSSERYARRGHRVEYIAELDAGITDPEVLALSRDPEAVLLTADSDFGGLVFRQRRAHSGVIPLRLSGLAESEKVALVASSVREHEEEFVGAFSVLTPTALRIRAPR